MAVLGQLGLPLGAERLGHDVLDRHAGAVEVDVYLGAQIRLESLEHEALLVGAAVRVVRDGRDPIADLLVVWPAPVAGKLAAQCDVDRLAGR